MEVRSRRKARMDRDGSSERGRDGKSGPQRNGSSAIKKLFFVFFVVFGIGALGYSLSVLRPVAMDDIPIFQADIKINQVLEQGERIIVGQVGPESMAIDKNGNIYTGLRDGRIIKIHPSATGELGVGLVEDFRNGPIPGVEPIDGHVIPRPLGLRLRGDILYVVDAYYGIYTLNMKTKEVRPLVKPDDVEPSMKFPNDLDISKDGKYIYFTDTSSKWNLGLFYYDVLEGECLGRLFRLTVKTGEIKLLASKLCFANGVQLSNDESRVAVSETTRFRVLFLDTKTGKVEKVTDVPSMPDNIRRSQKGGFWVALPIGRSHFVDFLWKYSILRRVFTGLVPYSLYPRFASDKYGLAVELDAKGNIVSYVHDITGKTSKTVSELMETKDGALFAGSYKEPYMVKVEKR
uniref:adipocyte plasma membrane-associated protein-like n=1 Tax=Styela clava TaxID=7725 RepID=UPI00193AD050|nr:adipocyte plasma membrane-associated protein-like [Styela clava]